jgi:excisionase family DNA binding protein
MIPFGTRKDKADRRRLLPLDARRGLQIAHAIEYSGIGQTRLRQYVREGRLAAYKIGKSLIIDRASLDALMESNRA